jgi:hypothetical protein
VGFKETRKSAVLYCSVSSRKKIWKVEGIGKSSLFKVDVFEIDASGGLVVDGGAVVG